MFMYLHKNKKGFTLIELMVVVAIIGILALLGLRLYTTQQDKAKEAIVKANASTVHTIIQSEMADGAVNINTLVDDTEGSEGALLTANLRNPFTAIPMAKADFVIGENTGAPAGTMGQIYIDVRAGGATAATHVEVTGIGGAGTTIPETLTARN